MSCFGDVARRLQETALDEATKGKQYIHSCLSFFSSRKQYGEGLKADCCSTGSAFLGGKKCEEGRYWFQTEGWTMDGHYRSLIYMRPLAIRGMQWALSLQKAILDTPKINMMARVHMSPMSPAYSLTTPKL
ncbi:hypothetical protein Bca52824_061892 [Brassica carinata]|uniref:Uncharacterized protein n=1 Tax=Brassica carinata TaxID=52824 RepID=A0A8X7QBW3_BRACI|nr:hypothetical protein Bca52824_061892 [Brassica carinata]